MGATYPKIELHVHLEGAVSPRALLDAAARNGCELPARTEEELERFMAFRDFEHFIEAWLATTTVLRTEDDYRELVLDYARRATEQGVVYLEGIFSPTDKLPMGVDMQTVFEGFCDGALQARDEVGLEIRLTPDITRGASPEVAEETARLAVAYRDRGVVGLGLGGLEAQFPPQPYARAFDIAREGGLGSVPHAGEVAGPSSIRGAIEDLGAARLRHGIRAVEDSGLLAEIAERRITCDVCVLSNLRLSVVPALEEHPLPLMIAAGVPCTVNTDDPTFFSCDLLSEHRAARQLGADPRGLYEAGIEGSLCEEELRAELRRIGGEHDWGAVPELPATGPEPA